MNAGSASCFEKNTQYGGELIKKSIDIQDAKYCQELCHKHEDCFFWTYFDPAYKGDEGANMCYLRAKKGTVKSIEHATSGAKKCEGMNFKDFLKTNW